MSKVITVAKSAEADDGKFEVTPFYDRGKLRMLWKLLVLSTKGAPDVTQTSSYEFKTIASLLIQLDGEVSRLDADTNVKISVERRFLNCIV